MALRFGPLTTPGLVALVVFVLAEVAFHNIWSTQPERIDYWAYDRAAFAIARGHSPYSTTQLELNQYLVERGTNTPRAVPEYLYSPLLAVVVLPLTLVPPGWAVRLFSLGSVLAAALLGVVLCQILGRPRLQPAVFGGLALYGPVQSTLHTGQINILVALLTALAVRAVIRSRPRVAGPALAAGTLLKTLPGVLVLWLVLRRQWRALAWTAGAAAIGITVTGLYFGFDLWSEYVSATWLADHTRQHIRIPSNQSLFGVAWALVPGDGGTTLAAALGAVVGVATLGIVVARDKVDPDGAVGASLLITATALAFPLFREHGQVVLTIPLVVLIREAHAIRVRAVGWVVAALVIASMGYCGLMLEELARHGIQGPPAPSEAGGISPMRLAHGFPLLQAAGTLGMALLWAALTGRLLAGKTMTARG